MKIKIIDFYDKENLIKESGGIIKEESYQSVEFSQKELNSMPKAIQKILILEKKRCRIRRHKSGKGFTYEIRFRRDGYDVSACGKTLDLAKANFLDKIKKAHPKGAPAKNETFNTFAMYYFDKFRIPKVSVKTTKNDLNRYKNHILPYLKEKELKKITPTDCQNIIDRLTTDGKGKTADEVFSLLNLIFKSAIAHGYIDKNPLATVIHSTHDRESGKALTESEIQLLFDKAEKNYKLPLALCLYCGLRPNELKSVEIDGKFIKAINSKRKGKKIEYKRIYIIDRLKPYIADLPLNFYMHRLTALVFNTLPTHRLYDLRTTFYTKCDELGVDVPARDYFVGHSSGVLTNAYRDLSEDYLILNGEKLNKW